MSELAVEMKGIVKRFPGVLANDQVDFAVRTGEIHALLGENGAGKTTLMNVLNGLYRPEAGEVFVNGRPANFNSPRDAIRSGIGMVHQHFMLVPTQTVAENLILGQRWPRFFINYQEVEERIADLSRQFGVAVDPRAKIWQLTVGEQQRVEILKMLYQGAKILIMDEPTAVLTPQEVEDLFKTLNNMTAAGHTVIFISHKLYEVIEISNRVTVLRRGKAVALVETAETTKAELAHLMVGREVLFRVEKKTAEPGKTMLVLNDVSCLSDRGLPCLKELSLELKAGEIVGIAGVAGNGQTELAEAITGLRDVTNGQIEVMEHDITNKPATAAINQGIAYIPADRNQVGSAPNLTLAENLIMKNYRRSPISQGWAIDVGTMKAQARRLIEDFNISTPGIETLARTLSGGNLQKLILAREFSDDPNVIVAVYPSRGLDVGATESVHHLLIQERDRGAAVLLISEDLDELLSLADRIVVLYEGQIMGEVPPDDEKVEEIGLMMAGTKM
ncbi:MAG: ABC transporter ATP-binding protein [Candidatus Promineifilaceae bacterium]